MDFSDQLQLADCEPKEWFVAFHRKSGRWWVKWLAWGRYQHVSAFGQVKNAGIWLFVEVRVSRMEVRAVPDSQADQLLAYYAGVGAILRIMAPIPADDRVKLKPGFWCVPVIAHLLGLRTCALRPDRLYRLLLANGGTIVVSDDDEIRSGPRTDGAAEASAG